MQPFLQKCITQIKTWLFFKDVGLWKLLNSCSNTSISSIVAKKVKLLAIHCVQEQLMKQWQQQQHSQAAQVQLQSQVPQQGPTPSATPQSGPKQPALYPPSSMGRPPPLPMNFDPRWMIMPYMDPRMMQGRPPPLDYYPASMHPTGSFIKYDIYIWYNCTTLALFVTQFFFRAD